MLFFGEGRKHEKRKNEQMYIGGWVENVTNGRMQIGGWVEKVVNGRTHGGEKGTYIIHTSHGKLFSKVGYKQANPDY